MSDGGVYPWKRQSVSAIKIADYSKLQNPLPEPPKGSAWFRDPTTREWKIVKIHEGEVQGIDPLALPADNRKIADKTLLDLPEDSDFLSHEVETSDTLQGICLKYHTTPTQLRQLNRFSGSNLAMAPKFLVIPLKQSVTAQATKTPQQDKESKINSFLLAFRFSKGNHNKAIGRKEAVAYLEMNDFNLDEAIADAKDDFGWEAGVQNSLHANESTPLVSA